MNGICITAQVLDVSSSKIACVVQIYWPLRIEKRHTAPVAQADIPLVVLVT